MARPDIKDICNILVSLGFVGGALGLYVLLAHGAYGSVTQPEAGESRSVSDLALTVQMADGRTYKYHPSPSVRAVPLAPAPAPEGWFRSFVRNFSVGITVPLVLLGIGELLSWMKRRHSSRAMKDKARRRVQERRRILRDMYAAQEELQALEEKLEAKRMDAGTNEQDSRALNASYKARKQELLFRLEDLRYQLRDMYEFATTGSADAGEFEGAADYDDQRSSRRPSRAPDRRNHSANYAADDRHASRTADFVHAAQGRSSTNSTGRSEEPAQRRLQEDRQFRDHTRQGSESKRPGRQNRSSKRAGQSRVEVIRQLLDEVPGMPPEEVLRIAEKAAPRGL